MTPLLRFTSVAGQVSWRDAALSVVAAAVNGGLVYCCAYALASRVNPDTAAGVSATIVSMATVLLAAFSNGPTPVPGAKK